MPTSTAMTNKMLNTTPMVANPLIVQSHKHTEIDFFLKYANIVQKNKV